MSIPNHSQDCEPDLLTAQEVARRLSIAPRTLWRLVRRGVVPPPVRYSRKLVRWRRVDIDRYIQNLPNSLNTTETP